MLEEYTHFINGNCHGFEAEWCETDDTVYELPGDNSHLEEVDLEDLDWQDADSCYGFIGDADNCVEDMHGNCPSIPLELFKKAADNYGKWTYSET
jgi:hypothetical protein